MGKIFYMMGKSSSGKDTLFQMVKERMPELRTIVLYTTRPIREGEREGVEYHFIEESKVKELSGQGRIIELRAYDTMYGVWKYMTVDDGQIRLDEESYLVIGTLESYEQMCRYFGSGQIIPIYIEVEDGLRLERALERERQQAAPRYDELCRRFLADTKDFSAENLERLEIRKHFNNIEIEQCLHEILLYIQKNM